MNITWKALRNAVDREALLKRMGIEERSTTGDFFTGLGLFSLGVLLGAGLGLVFAPKRGEEMRETLTEAWKKRGRGEQEQTEPAAGSAVQPQRAEELLTSS